MVMVLINHADYFSYRTYLNNKLHQMVFVFSIYYYCMCHTWKYAPQSQARMILKFGTSWQSPDAPSKLNMPTPDRQPIPSLSCHGAAAAVLSVGHSLPTLKTPIKEFVLYLSECIRFSFFSEKKSFH